MPAWYDIVGLDDRSGESCEGIEDSMAEIQECLEEEARSGIP